MIGILAQIVGSITTATAVGGAGVLGSTTNKATSGVQGLPSIGDLILSINNAFTDVGNKIIDAFTSHTTGAGATDVASVLSGIKRLTSENVGITPDKLLEVERFLLDNKVMLKQLDNMLNLRFLTKQLTETIELNKQTAALINSIKTITSITVTDINVTTSKAFNAIIMTDGSNTSGIYDFSREIPQWLKDQSENLKLLGFIGSYSSKQIVPINVFKYGGNAAFMIWGQTATIETINNIIDITKELFKQFINQYELLKYQLRVATTVLDDLIKPKPGATIPEEVKPTPGSVAVPGAAGRQHGRGLLGALLGGVLLEMLKELTRSSSRIVDKRRRRKKKGKLRLPKFPKDDKDKDGKPKRKIKEISVNVRRVSAWVSRIRFVFPEKRDIDSDEKGSIYFYLKNGGVIRFKRVKRGTFSVISQVFGTGYRIWSQFWKRKIVNKPPSPEAVLSWFIKRINEQDRKIGIEEEIKDSKVKYR